MSAPAASRSGAGSNQTAWVDVTAALVQSVGFNRDCAFARVLVTFDPARRHDLLFLNDILLRVFALSGKRSLTRDEQFVRDLVAAMPDKSRWQRWELPASVTDGIPVFLCELPLYFNRLPAGERTLLEPTREMGMIPCRAKPKGGIEQLPYTPSDVYRREDEFVRLVESRGVQLTAIRAQANQMLYKPGTQRAPGLVLITFDTNIVNRDSFLMDLAERVYDLKELRPRNDDERDVADIVHASERAGMLYRRRRLPTGFTGGPTVYAADLIINPRYLRHGYLTVADARLPVVAERGPSGAIELMPYWKATGEAPPKYEEPVEVQPVDARPVPAGDWIDVTDDVLGDPIPVVSAVSEYPPQPRRRRFGWLFAVLALFFFGGAFTCAGGSALWYFALRSPIHLSNPRPVALFGFRQGATVDFEVRRGPDPAMRYQIVVKNNRTGLIVRNPIAFGPSPSRGAVTLSLPATFGFGLPQQTDYDVYVEATHADGSGGSEKVSNTIVVTQ
jgi:hypothetical protein